MKKGIFDPWRQEAPAPPPSTKGDDPREAAPPTDPDEPEMPKQCVAFHGLRAGVNVWLEEEHGSDYVQRAQNAIVDVIVKLQRTHQELLEQRGVSMDPSKRGLTFSKGRHTVVIGIEQDDDKRMKRAVDTLSLALRATINDSTAAAAIITAAGIKPFVK